MRWMMRILILLFLVVIGAGGFLALFPGRWVREPLLAWVAKRLAQTGHRIEWRELKISVDREGLLTWRVRLGAAFVSYRAPEEAVVVRAEPLSTDFRIRWFPFGWPQSFAFERLEAGDLGVSISSATPESGTEAEAASDSISPWPYLPEIGRVVIQRAGIRWGKRASEAISGRFETTRRDARQEWMIAAKWQGDERRDSGRARVLMKTLPSGGPFPWPVDIDAEASGARDGWTGKVTIGGRVEDESEGKLSLVTQLSGTDGKLNATLSGHGGPDRGAVTIDGRWAPSSRELPLVKVAGGTVAWEQKGRAWNVNWSFPASLKPPQRFASAFSRHEWFEVNTNGDARVALTGLAGPARVRVTMGPLLSPTAWVEARLPRGISRESKEFQPAAAELRVERFEDLVRWLADTPFAVPQPLAQLKGSIAVGIDGIADLFALKGKFPVTAAIDLTGEKQRLSVAWKGEISGSLDAKPPRVRVAGEAILKEAILALPELKLESLPPIAPDSRFISLTRRAPAEEDPVRFDYDIRVRTAAPGALKLLSSLGPELVPLSLDIRARPAQGVEGSVSAGEFSVKLVRKQVKVRRLRVWRNQSTGSWEVDGRFELRHADYQVEAIVVGPVDHPQLRLFSVPPLRQDQILALLVFGRPIEELETDQAMSVGSAEAALADGALNLVSIFALASTPIESVQYDPRTGKALAKVRLGDGTTLAVGSQGTDLQRVGVRQRIAADWYIQTYLESLNDWEKRSVSALLEWIRRY